jgi:ATP-binding cassette subfamily C protein
MRFLITIARMYPGRTVLSIFSLLFSSVAEGVGLLLLLPVIGAVTGETGQGKGNNLFGVGDFLTQSLSYVGLSPTVGPLLIIVVLCIALKSIFLLVAKAQVGYTVAHIATEFRLSLLRSLLAAKWAFYVRQPVGGLANAVGTEAIRASAAYQEGAKAVSFVIQVGVYSGVAFLVDWKATLGVLAVGAIVLYGLNRLVRIAHQAGKRQTQLLTSLLTRLTDSLQSVKPLKAMAREDLIGPLLGSDTRRLNKALRREVISTEALSAIQDLVFAIVIAAGLYVALDGLKLPFNAVMVMVLVIAKLLSALSKMQRDYQRMRSFDSAFWSLQATIEAAKSNCEAAPGGLTPLLEKSLRLDKVTFSYETTQVLWDASLSIPAGSFTAIVGPSGAGKTTIADLFTGLIRPQQGHVWIDDLLLEQVDLRQWRRMIGYVPQETFLLHDSVFMNVTLGDANLAEADAEEALRAAGAWDFVMALPMGVRSSVGERGAALSGGQRQRIAIARALAHRPKLLILDEVTSALDPDSEAAICRTLQGLRGQLTILAISHQPAIVQAADSVYRLERGHVSLSSNGKESALVFGEPQSLPKIAGS